MAEEMAETMDVNNESSESEGPDFDDEVDDNENLSRKKASEIRF